MNGKDANDLYPEFIVGLQDAVEECIPKKKIREGRGIAIDSRIKGLIQRKKHAFLIWMKNKDNELLKDRFKMRSKEV